MDKASIRFNFLSHQLYVSFRAAIAYRERTGEDACGWFGQQLFPSEDEPLPIAA